MSAPVLLSDYKMKKKKSLRAKRESEAPVTLEFMREFRAEIMSRFSAIDARLDRMDARMDGLDARVDGLNAKIDQGVAEIKAISHQTKLVVEEQNVRNKQAYDGYVLTYGALEDLKSRIKPECLKD